MKKKNENHLIPLACVPSAMTKTQREKYHLLLDNLSSSPKKISELADGYRVCYPAESTMIMNLAEFISLERLCCPFLHFALVVEPNQAVSLHLTGPEGVKKLLKETFDWI
jgi:hypothetical protein